MVISQASREKIADEIAKYPRPRGALLPALHIVHAEHGFVSPECAQELAQIFEIRPFEVTEVVSFYNMFYTTPQARHQVRVCTNLPCSLRGARQLLGALESHLGVKPGETTKDGRITLGHEECLGACAYAPMLRVDEVYHENLDVEKARQIVDGLA
jgi:NADH-quinone oxidoreductase subunit E